MKNAKNIIDSLSMKIHPEGGYFVETYRSETGYSFENKIKIRAYCSCIYFLLESGQKSNFHRIKQDELWHFYSGSALEIHKIDAEGKYSKAIIGNDNEIFNFQELISANTWMAATPIDDNSFTLIGCTVAPAFEFDDFELANREELISKNPNLSDIIIKFTNNN